jgi:hypothetical protein
MNYKAIITPTSFSEGVSSEADIDSIQRSRACRQGMASRGSHSTQRFREAESHFDRSIELALYFVSKYAWKACTPGRVWTVRIPAARSGARNE